ncbi:MAG: hypothetical protein ABI903_16080 [Actinomycetota bacterium]
MSTFSPRPPAAIRSLADDVRGRNDEQLRALVGRRPDLARPDRALLWRSGNDHQARGAGRLRGARPHPAGLGPAIAELPGSTPAWHDSPRALDAVIATAQASARSILDLPSWAPPIGTLSPRRADGRRRRVALASASHLPNMSG